MESQDVDDEDDDDQQDELQPAEVEVHAHCMATRYPLGQESASQDNFQQDVGCGEPVRYVPPIKPTAGLAGKNGHPLGIGSVGLQLTNLDDYSASGKNVQTKAVPK